MVLAMQTASEYLEISSVQLTFFAEDKNTQNKMKLFNKLEDKYPELLNWMGKEGNEEAVQTQAHLEGHL